MMTYKEAVERLLKSCADYESLVKLLKDQNAFLTETIEKHNLGKINKERKSLYENMNQAKKEAALALKNANLTKSQYLEKLKEIESLNKMLKDKQNNLDMYIDSQVSVKTKEIQNELSDYKISTSNKINFYIQENEILKSQNLLYQDENKKLKNLVSIVISIFIIYVFITKAF